MSFLKLILRSLAHYRRANVAVVFGAAVGVAVITGSLLIGDSARGSLRDLALARLGRTDHALVSLRLFRQGLADDVAGRLGDAVRRCAPLVMLDGTALAPASGVSLPRTAVLGVDERFWQFGEVEPGPLPDGRSVVINRTLAADLGVGRGESIILRVPRLSDAAVGSLFGRRSREDTVQQIRVTVGRVIADRGLGMFTLRGDRPRPRSVYVSLPWLQQQLGVADRANVLLVEAEGGIAATSRRSDELADALSESVALEDYRLRLVTHRDRGYLSLESRESVLPADVAEAAQRIVRQRGLQVQPASIYLANAITLLGAGGGDGDAAKSIPYSTIAAIDPSAPPPFGPLPAAGETALPKTLAADDILLNAWAAADLGAKVGDKVEISYYRIRPDGTLDDGGRRAFTLRGVVALEGPARDRGLVPEFKGITDADNMDSWNPPFKIDMSRIRDKDEKYWNDYRATPKAFISFDAARELWRSGQSGAAEGTERWLTSVRIGPAADAPEAAATAPAEAFDRWAADTAQAVTGDLVKALDPAKAGLAFRPVKAAALRAAQGSTDFAMLFLSMSFFLVIAAAMLVVLLMRLSVEQRAGQIGLLLATGFSPRQASRLVVIEGLVLSLAATVVGLALGVAYARGIIAALATLWVGALGPFTLSLHVTPLSLLIGGLTGLAVLAAAVWWSARILRRTAALDLLGGWQVMSLPSVRQRRRIVPPVVVVVSLALAATVLVLSLATGTIPTTAAFFLCGALLLAAGLAGGAVALDAVARGGASTADPRLSLVRLAVRSAARQRLRSLLTAGLVATAAFAIVAVAANRVDLAAVSPADRQSGTGGFALLGRSDLPMLLDPATPEGRAGLGFDEDGRRQLEGATVVALRARSGDDASCLNLQRPLTPRVVGVPATLRDRGGFPFLTLLPGGSDGRRPDNPWMLLDRQLPDGSIPAFGDESSTKWILKVGLGDTVSVPGPRGDVRLKLVGLLRGSLWQSDLLIAEEQFTRAFGPEDGYRVLLVDVAPERTEAVRKALARNLGDFGLDVRRTSDVLAEYAGVQNAYLSTFQTLGGLGLVLGTFAVVTVLLRNILERRSELGMMLALGFRRTALVHLVTLESMLLVAAGLVVGTAAALLAVAPHMAESKADVPWLSILVTLLAVAAVGLAACRIAAGRVLDGRLLEAIRCE